MAEYSYALWFHVNGRPQLAIPTSCSSSSVPTSCSSFSSDFWLELVGKKWIDLSSGGKRLNRMKNALKTPKWWLHIPNGKVRFVAFEHSAGIGINWQNNWHTFENGSFCILSTTVEQVALWENKRSIECYIDSWLGEYSLRSPQAATSIPIWIEHLTYECIAANTLAVSVELTTSGEKHLWL